ncbi:hypothetical protein E2C01_050016 [Portunus trituberculatus]|uniref:Secreted protein n=1 Tax=Portunus trituberculatus TaxID=210409 RepID=A0A5B7GET5_PORTR|nr:hypothetical protein [Portunus trituberculatus]
MKIKVVVVVVVVVVLSLMAPSEKLAGHVIVRRYCGREPRGDRRPRVRAAPRGYIHQTVRWPSIKISSVTTVDPEPTMANWQ